MPYTPIKADIDSIIDEYQIDVNSTRTIILPNLPPSTHLFKVNRADLIEDLYIIDTPEGRSIACHPHIVGDKLKHLATNAAIEAAKIISQLTSIHEVDWESVIVENVLRAAPGYELNTAFKYIFTKSFRDVWIRPRYKQTSYRDHDDEIGDNLNIVYEDFDDLPFDKELVVLKPDTEATGKTGKKSIERLIQRCGEVGSTVREIILYGFISIPSIKLIHKTVRSKGIRLIAFSIGNITNLAYNGYDMTLYGLDESYWKATEKIKKLGSIVDIMTLQRYLPLFVPGSDQPGDWSNRQTAIHITKDEKMEGGIIQHLQNSIHLIKNLYKISNYSLWQKEIAKKELQCLQATLTKYKR